MTSGRPETEREAVAMSSVKVAVRVRPFNAREKGRNAVSIIAMEGKTTCKVMGRITVGLTLKLVPDSPTTTATACVCSHVHSPLRTFTTIHKTQCCADN